MTKWNYLNIISIWFNKRFEIFMEHSGSNKQLLKNLCLTFLGKKGKKKERASNVIMFYFINYEMNRWLKHQMSPIIF